ncbi:hypothetical protein RI129_013073 [Pyrocoelia pectoralis]|uniref:RRM domain-containing protein n=1 Tax=Pyrocoelia pectoralis TaxID=417401 RepID=A0AAN7V3X9_9COLE
MSTPNQNNGKKSNSNSVTNTPSSTPVTTITNPLNTQAPIQSTSPPNNAPKYGTLVPNRIFVGGISANTTEAELLQLFSNYGTVKAAKIIQDRAGVSKGYGFVTFETEEDAKRLQREADNIVLRERKLNIAPAIKKQPFSRGFEAASPQSITPGAHTPYFIPGGNMPFYHSGMTYYSQAPPPGDPTTQQPPVYQTPSVYTAQSGPPQTAAYPSIVYPTQPLYMPQQFPYQPVPYDYGYYTNGGPQYIVGNQNTSQPPGHSMQPPGSPPRTPCFNPPMPYSADSLYFNMPMYSNAIEASSIYQDSLDMANGNLNEEPYGYLATIPNEMGSAPPSNVNNIQGFPTVATDFTRQSNTPVVSVLSLDQHQERDFMSLQSGWRRKSTETIPNNVHDFSNNVVVVPYENSSNYTHSQSAYHHSVNINGYVVQNDLSVPKYSSHSHIHDSDRLAWQNRRRNSNTTDEPQSQTNLGSGGGIDENRNEEKNCTNNTPPPAPYSPILQCGLAPNKYNSRKFHNTTRSGRGHFPSYNNNHYRYNSFSANRERPNYHNYASNKMYHKRLHDPRPKTENCAPTMTDTPNVSAGNSSLETPPIHVTNGSNSLPPQISSSLGSMSFTPPRRSGKRSMRRTTTASSTNEIGAGDAPLPCTDVLDACKKLDNLKL